MLNIQNNLEFMLLLFLLKKGLKREHAGCLSYNKQLTAFAG